MTSRDFCYWLQGFFELVDAQQHEAGNKRKRKTPLDAKQIECIRAHLALVFKHEIDPSMGTPEHQAELRKIHESIAKVTERMTQHVRVSHGHGSSRDVKLMC